MPKMRLRGKEKVRMRILLALEASVADVCRFFSLLPLRRDPRKIYSALCGAPLAFGEKLMSAVRARRSWKLYRYAPLGRVALMDSDKIQSYCVFR